MKNIKLLFCLLIMCMFVFIDNISAVGDTKITDTNQLIAKCVYKYYHNTEKKDIKWEIYIKKDYSISGYSADVKYGTYYYNYIVDSTFRLKYEDFLTEDKEVSCEKLSTIYSEYRSAKDDEHTQCDNNPGDGTCNTYEFAKNKSHFDVTVFGKTSNYSVETKLVPEESVVYIKKPDQQAVDSGKWDLVCHYGSFYLHYNDTTFETNAAHKNIFTHEGIKALVEENQQSCPTTYCEYTQEVGGFSYELTQSYFTNEYESRDGCHVSVQYAKEYTCGVLNTQMENYHKALEEKNKIKVNIAKQNIQKFCSNVFDHLKYTDSNKCVKECLDVVDIIANDIYSAPLPECGFSGRLLIWVGNIVRWMKYIVPVIVIVLGILDFIKAMASSKEDEMKKAQKGFIIRLIAAALIFISPFIIEFVLDKMGFSVNGCGIIDL